MQRSSPALRRALVSSPGDREVESGVNFEEGVSQTSLISGANFPGL